MSRNAVPHLGDHVLGVVLGPGLVLDAAQLFYGGAVGEEVNLGGGIIRCFDFP